MNIVFRVDASYKIGSGHIFRCLVIADTLKREGCNVVFICRMLQGHLINLIRDRGFEVIVLGLKSSSIDHTNDRDWLGVSQQTDAEETLKNLKDLVIDIVFVDHYSLDTIWETMMKPIARSIVVIDDLANRDHNCDYLIDQNFRYENLNCYDDLVPKSCKKLLGLQYAIMSPEYRNYRKIISKRSGNISRVLIYFGGTDWQDMTSLALRVLSEEEFRFLEVDIVVGSNYPSLKDLKKLITNRPKTTLHQYLPNLANLMSVADLAIGAGGTTMLERISMGLPALVISLAENQLQACKSLQKEGLIHYLGSYTDITNALLSKSLRERIHNPEDNSKLSSKLSAYVDGLGDLRIAHEVLTLSSEMIRLSKN